MKYGLLAIWLGLIFVPDLLAESPKTITDELPLPIADGQESRTLNTLSPPMPETSFDMTETSYMPETSYRPETSYQSETSHRPETGFAATIIDVELANVKSKEINERVEGARLRGYLAEPETREATAGLILVPEWWGLNNEIKTAARKLASQGFRVLAVDLYNGSAPANRREAARLMRQVKPGAALEQLKAGLKLAGESEDGKELPVGVIGWGFGGGLALKLAAADKRPKAVVVYYGELLKDSKEIARLSSPILGFFSDRDGWVTPDKLRAFRNALKESDANIQTFSYGVPPGFALHPKTAAEFNYAEIAEKKMLTFLQQKLFS